MSNFWDKEEGVGAVETVGSKEIRVSVGERNERVYITIKEWYTGKDDEMYPSKNQGINIIAESADELVSLLAEAAEEAAHWLKS